MDLRDIRIQLCDKYNDTKIHRSSYVIGLLNKATIVVIDLVSVCRMKLLLIERDEEDDEGGEEEARKERSTVQKRSHVKILALISLHALIHAPKWFAFRSFVITPIIRGERACPAILNINYSRSPIRPCIGREIKEIAMEYVTIERFCPFYRYFLDVCNCSRVGSGPTIILLSQFTPHGTG